MCLVQLSWDCILGFFSWPWGSSLCCAGVFRALWWKEEPWLGLQQLLLDWSLVLWDPWAVPGVHRATQQIVSIAEKWAQPHFLVVYWSLRTSSAPATESGSYSGRVFLQRKEKCGYWKCKSLLGEEALDSLWEHRNSHPCIRKWGTRTLSRAAWVELFLGLWASPGIWIQVWFSRKEWGNIFDNWMCIAQYSNVVGPLELL